MIEKNKNKKWEYAFGCIEKSAVYNHWMQNNKISDALVFSTLKDLNRIGEEGWELCVDIDHSIGGKVFVFKREKTEQTQSLKV